MLARHYLFAGRVRELNSLATALLPQAVEGIAPPQVVTGMGGLGKTQLVVEFAHRYGQLFRGAHWLNLADSSRLDFEIAFNGEKMGLPNWPQDQPSQVNYTLQQWKANGPRLIVLDNFEDVDQAPEVLVRLRHSNLRIVITSRRADWPASTGAEILPLGFLDAQESLKFLKLSLKNRKDSDADLLKLAERFGYLPLAMELAERYLAKQPRLGIDAYLKQLEQPLDHESMKEWRKDLPNPTKHDIDLFGTIRSSWNDLPGDAPRLLLILAGYLVPIQPIPLEIFETYLGLSPQDCDANLEILYGFGLMRQNEDGLPYIHPLVADFSRRAHRNISLSKGADPQEKANNIIHNMARTLLALSNPALESQMPKQCEPYYPHMKQIALQAGQLNDDNAGNLLNNCGAYLYFIGEFQGALESYERALKANDAIYGANSVQVAVNLTNLANLRKQLGDYPNALEYFQAALKITEDQNPPDEGEITNALSSIGAIHVSLADFTKARSFFRQALRIKLKIYPKNHAAFADDFNGLGVAEIAVGNLRKAYFLLRRALKIRESSLPNGHPAIASTLSSLGMTFREMGSYTEAESAFERAKLIYESAYGVEHYETASVLAKLGAIYIDTERIAQAKSAFEQVLQIQKKIFGAESVVQANTLVNLAIIARNQKDLENAESLLKQALEMYESAYGNEDARVAGTLSDLGLVLLERKNLPQAREVLNRAIAIYEGRYGTDNALLAGPLNTLAVALNLLGEKERAIQLEERAIALLMKHRPQDEDDLRIYRKNLDLIRG